MAQATQIRTKVIQKHRYPLTRYYLPWQPSWYPSAAFVIGQTTRPVLFCINCSHKTIGILFCNLIWHMHNHYNELIVYCEFCFKVVQSAIICFFLFTSIFVGVLPVCSKFVSVCLPGSLLSLCIVMFDCLYRLFLRKLISPFSTPTKNRRLKKTRNLADGWSGFEERCLNIHEVFSRWVLQEWDWDWW